MLSAWILAALTTAAFQPVAPAAPLHSTEALAFLDGRWEGTAEGSAPDDTRFKLRQVEAVCPLVGG